MLMASTRPLAYLSLLNIRAVLLLEFGVAEKDIKEPNLVSGQGGFTA
jgi:hypothetical protein